MTTQRNFLSNVETAIRVTGIDRSTGPQMRGLISVPLFHVTGCNSQLLVGLALGSCTVVLPTFDVRTFLRTIVDERIDQLTSVPAIYALAMAQPDFGTFDISAVTKLSYGGAPMAPDLVRRITERFPNARVGNGFGLTETASIATYLPHEWAAEHADSVGLRRAGGGPRGGRAGRDRRGRAADPGPDVVAGYWNKPDATEETFSGGWFRSGDLARVEPSGLTYIVDRAKDMINRGGENVYSVEVENALAGAPGVAEAAVVGVPDEVMGEKVAAILVAAPGASIDREAVLDYLSERLAAFKLPQYLALRTDPLPRNPGGKILKRHLRDQTTWGQPLRRR